MNREYVKAAMEAVSDAELALTLARQELQDQLRDAKTEGATVAQLMQWTGYSRRTVFYMLKH